jgi:adenine phosphoribosyltransferase
VPIRKPGKLPWKTNRVEYALEYGKNAVEIHQDGVRAGERVLLVDDLLATGGTMGAGLPAGRGCGGIVASCVFVVELRFLPGGSAWPRGASTPDPGSAAGLIPWLSIRPFSPDRPPRTRIHAPGSARVP